MPPSHTFCFFSTPPRIFIVAHNFSFLPNNIKCNCLQFRGKENDTPRQNGVTASDIRSEAFAQKYRSFEAAYDEKIPF